MGVKLSGVAAVSVIPGIFLVFYGVHGGMPWDFSLTYLSEINPGLEGFFYRGDPLRVYTNVFCSKAVGSVTMLYMRCCGPLKAS